MRRSLFATIGAAAMLVLAACSTDQQREDPLAPSEVGLAKGGGGGSPLCAGGLAADIAKLQDYLYAGDAELLVEDKFDDVKAGCPLAAGDPALMSYLETMIDSSGAPNANADSVAALLGKVTLYATGSALVRPASVFGEEGAAGVLTVIEGVSGDAVISFDKGARLLFDKTTRAITATSPSQVTEAFGMRLFTFTPLSSDECGDITGLRLAPRGDGAPCYDVHDWPDAVGYTPAATLTICLHRTDVEKNDGLVHEKTGFGDEVLEPVLNTYSCGGFHGNPTSWLERNGGPLGRVLARAYDFLAPKTLIADDAGESGSLGFFSKVGVILNDIFRDDFSLDNATAFNANPGAVLPDLGDLNQPWIYSASTPGFIRIQESLGNMTNGVLVLSQGQGACNNCPVFRLLGEVRTDDEAINNQNETDYETNGSFDVIFTSLQNKPSVKEAPFIILNGEKKPNGEYKTEAEREIVRLSYVTQSSQNRLLLKVAGISQPIVVGSWVQNVSQTFKITVNLNVLNDTYDKTVSVAIYNPLSTAPDKFDPVAGAQNITAAEAKSLKHIGYILTGIDAGIIGSDDWLVTRLPDIPPP